MEAVAVAKELTPWPGNHENRPTPKKTHAAHRLVLFKIRPPLSQIEGVPALRVIRSQATSPVEPAVVAVLAQAGQAAHSELTWTRAPKQHPTLREHVEGGSAWTGKAPVEYRECRADR